MLLAVEGSCHCGRVRCRVTGDLDTVCSCSICTKKGAIHLVVPKDRFGLLSGEAELSSYRFNTGVAQHHFCRHCGLHPFCVPRSDPDGIDVNVRCLDGVAPDRLRPHHFDAQHWERAIQQRLAWREDSGTHE